MNTKRLLAVGVNLPDIGTIIVTEQDALGTLCWAEFVEGMNAATAGADLSEMQTADMEAGWFYARKCIGSKYSADDGSVEDDADFNRWGC